MDTQVDVSEKLRWEEFRKIVDTEPLQCFYQVLSNDSYTSSGYSFYVKSPGHGILLDPNIWIKYNFTLTDTANNAIGNNYNTAAAAADTFANIYAATNNRIGFRGGNIFQRATQNITAIINGHSITAEPWKFVDVLNRLYISQDQSKHEFSASGGQFDSGNHSLRIMGDVSSAGISDAAINNQTLGVNAIPGFHSNAEIQATGGVRTLISINPAPDRDYFVNQGYNDRCMKFADAIRRHQAPNAQVTVQYGTNAANNIYTFNVYERLPLPPFKMYSNDEVYGMIPNIRDMTIRGQFTSNFVPNVIRATSAANFTFALAGTPEGCQLFIKWFTPPPQVSIPRSISMPLRKINVWSATQTIAALAAAGDNNTGVAITPGVSQYNISLDAVPDLLLLYFRYRMDSWAITYPDDYMMEMSNLQINIEGASGKLNQIQTIQLYDNWKKLLKHQDPNIAPYDEWRRYMCVAALRPSDYGCINGPGYSNPITLGVTCDLKNYWNISKMGLIAAENYNGTLCEFVVTSIYDKWSLTINDSGSASSALERVSPPNYASPASVGLSQLQPIPSSLRNII